MCTGYVGSRMGNELSPDFVSQTIKTQPAKKTVLIVSTETLFTVAGGISRCKCNVITCTKTKRGSNAYCLGGTKHRSTTAKHH